MSAVCRMTLQFKLVEPLRLLFKDEVRSVGLQLRCHRRSSTATRSLALGWRSASLVRSTRNGSRSCAMPMPLPARN